MKCDVEEPKHSSGPSQEELARKARLWKASGIAQLVLTAATVTLLTLYKFRGSLVFLAIGAVCAVVILILLLRSSCCPVCGHEIRRWERYFGTLFFRCPDCGFSIHAGEEEMD